MEGQGFSPVLAASEPESHKAYHPTSANITGSGIGMVEELEREYVAVRDKVRDLREYL